MTFPSPQEIIDLAEDHGYIERRPEASSTLFFQKNNEGKYPTLINIFYTTRGAMTKLSHPKSGYNQLWRSDAYDSLETLARLFQSPRIHTGTGYRKADQSVRGCSQCGCQRKSDAFSKNQWRKGPGSSKCQDCVAGKEYRTESASIPINNNISVSENTVASASREFITCDATGCDAVAPAILCDSCHTTYYCSQACQTRHFQEEHYAECRPIDQMRRAFATWEEPDPQEKRAWAMVTQLSGKRTFDAILHQAEYIHQADGQWEVAIELYMELLMNNEQEAATPPQWRQVWMGLSRCYYEMGINGKAIQSGMAALAMNRHFPQSHKYVALSQQAIGDHDAAIATMTRAVLYEAPWEDKNLELNKVLLKQIIG